MSMAEQIGTAIGLRGGDQHLAGRTARQQVV